MEIIISIQEILTIILEYAIMDNVAHKPLMRTCKVIKETVVSLIVNNIKFSHLQRASNPCYGKWFSDWFFEIAKNDYFPMLLLIEDFCRKNIKMIQNRIIEGALVGGHLRIICWAFNANLYEGNFNNNYSNYVFRASANGHLHILKWINNKYNFVEEDNISCKHIRKYACCHAAGQGHIHILDWLKGRQSITKKQQKKEDYQNNESSQNQHKPKVQGFDFSRNIVVGDLYPYYIDYYKFERDVDQVIGSAAEGGQLDVLKWIIAHWNNPMSPFHESIFSFILYTACIYNHRPVIQWVFDNGYININSFLKENKYVGLRDFLRNGRYTWIVEYLKIS